VSANAGSIRAALYTASPPSRLPRTADDAIAAAAVVLNGFSINRLRSAFPRPYYLGNCYFVIKANVIGARPIGGARLGRWTDVYIGRRTARVDSLSSQHCTVHALQCRRNQKTIE